MSKAPGNECGADRIMDPMLADALMTQEEADRRLQSLFDHARECGRRLGEELSRKTLEELARLQFRAQCTDVNVSAMSGLILSVTVVETVGDRKTVSNWRLTNAINAGMIVPGDNVIVAPEPGASGAAHIEPRVPVDVDSATD